METQLKTPKTPSQSSVAESIAYTVVFDEGRLISTPTVKRTPKSERKTKAEIGALNEDDEKLMCDILEEVENKQKREKLEEKLMIAEIMREAHNKEIKEKARRSRKAMDMASHQSEIDTQEVAHTSNGTY